MRSVGRTPGVRYGTAVSVLSSCPEQAHLNSNARAGSSSVEKYRLLGQSSRQKLMQANFKDFAA